MLGRTFPSLELEPIWLKMFWNELAVVFHVTCAECRTRKTLDQFPACPSSTQKIQAVLDGRTGGLHITCKACWRRRLHPDSTQ